MASDQEESTVETAARKVTKKIRKSKKAKAKKRGSGKSKQSKGNIRRPYPRETLERALMVPRALKENNGGNPWPPADVATSIGLSHTNSDFFYLAASSRDFGLTDGGRDSKLISLTEAGRDVVYAPGKVEERAALIKALLKVEIFRKVLDYYKGANLPEMQYLGNTLVREFGLDETLHEEFSRLFRENCTFLNIGSGFTSEDPLRDSQLAPKKLRENTATVVLAEPASNTGLKCFAIMPFTDHVKGAWEHRDSNMTFMKILRDRKTPK
jgi:hypothetical protein